MKDHVVVEFDDGLAVWASAEQPIAADIRLIHLAHTYRLAPADTLVERVRSWHAEHREQSERCAQHECDCYAP